MSKVAGQKNATDKLFSTSVGCLAVPPGSLLLSGEAVSQDDTQNKTGGGNEKENKERVSVTLRRVNVAHLACAVDNRPCHPLHHRHSEQGEGVHEAGHEAHNGRRSL
jgi:hypothetical protein